MRDSTLKETANYVSHFQGLTFRVIVFRKRESFILEVIGPGDHMGGIGIGIPYMKETSKLTANCHSISFPKHRDGELAAEIARIVAKITQRKVLVILGVHIPNLTEPILQDLKSFFKKWITEIAKELDHIS